jgi:hypothetical protein
MVSLTHHTAMLARVPSERQRHVLPIPTICAGLRGESRRNFDHLPLSFSRFSDKYIEEHRPGRIRDRFVQSSFGRRSVRQVRSVLGISCLVLGRCIRLRTTRDSIANSP